MSEGNKTVSLRPTDAVQGGLLDDADVLVTGARFDFFTYTTGQSGVGAIVEFQDADEKTHEQFYSAGDASKFVPSDDKKRLLMTGSATGLAKGSNTYELLSSLVSSGFPEDKLADGDISVIVGLRAHVNRKAMPKAKNAAEDAKERSVLVVTKVIALPGAADAKGKGGKTATKAASTAPAAATATSDVDSEAAGIVIALLAENGGSIERTKISQLAFQKLQTEKNPNKAKITTRVYQEEFLKSIDGVSYDGKIVSMAA